MALFTQPDKNSIAQDGFKLCGYPSPSATQQTLGEGWIEEAKMDIWNIMNKSRVKLRSLLVTSFGVTAKGISRYANPSDCDEIYSINLLDGSDTGTSQAAAAGEVTLAADETITEAKAVGKMLLLTSGTAVGNCSQISAYDTSTLAATLTPNYTGSSYDGNEDYMVIETSKALKKNDPKELDEINEPYDKEEPIKWYPQGQGVADTDESGEFELYPNPDDLYGLKIRYYLNIMLLDLTSDANLIGSLYRRLKPIFIAKIIYRQQQTDRNFEYSLAQENRYWSMIDDFITSGKDVGYTGSREDKYY